MDEPVCRNLKVREFNRTELRQLETALRARAAPSTISRMLGLTEGLLPSSQYDVETLRRVGRTPEDVADKLRGLIGAYRARKERLDSSSIYEPENIGQFSLKLKRSRGSMSCRFQIGCDGFSTSDTFRITNTSLGKELQVGEMLVHFIKDHHFFEGQVSEYRVDPLYAAYVLGIISGDTYASEKDRERLPDPKIDIKNAPLMLERAYRVPPYFETKPGSEHMETLEELKCVLTYLVCEAEFRYNRSHIASLVSALVADVTDPASVDRAAKMRVLSTLATVEAMLPELTESIPRLKPLESSPDDFLQQAAGYFFAARRNAERHFPEYPSLTAIWRVGQDPSEESIPPPLRSA